MLDNCNYDYTCAIYSILEVKDREMYEIRHLDLELKHTDWFKIANEYKISLSLVWLICYMMLNYSNIQDKIIALLSPINISIVRFFFSLE